MRTLLVYMFLLILTLTGKSQEAYAAQPPMSAIDSLVIQSEAKEGITQIDVLLQLANKTFSSNVSQSMGFARKALQLSEKMHYMEMKANSILFMAQASEKLNDKQTADAFQKQWKSLNEECVKKKSEAGLLAEESNMYFRKGLYRRSLDRANKALDIYQLLGDNKKIAELKILIGLVYKVLSDYDLSIKYTLQAMNIADDYHDTRMGISARQMLGDRMLQAGEIRAAFLYYEDALKIARETRDKNAEANMLHDLGITCREQGDYHKGLDFLEEALAIRQENSDKIGEAACLNDIGVLYSRAGQPDSALPWHNEALYISLKLGKQQLIASCKQQIGKVLLADKAFPQAIECFQVSMSIRNGNGDKRGVAADHLYIAEAYLGMNDANKAYVHLQEGSKIAASIPLNPELNMSCYKVFATYYEAKHNYENALKYYKQYVALSNEMNQRFGKYQLATIHVDYLERKKEEENRIVELTFQKRQELMHSENQSNTRMLTLIFSGLLLLVIISLIIPQRKLFSQPDVSE